MFVRLIAWRGASCAGGGNELVTAPHTNDLDVTRRERGGELELAAASASIV